MKKSIFTISLLSALSCSAAICPMPARAGDDVPEILKPHQARYEVWRRGSKLGELMLTLQADGNGQYRYHGTTTATSRIARMLRVGADESASFLWTLEGLRPLHYQMETSAPGKSRFWAVDFDWQTGRATRNGDTDQPHTAITPGVIDPLSLRLEMAIALAAGHPWERDFSFQVLERKRLETQTFRPLGFFHLTLPAGCMNALQLERVRDDSDRELHSWHAPDFGWLPVRVRQLKDGKEEMDVRLAESELLDGASLACE